MPADGDEAGGGLTEEVAQEFLRIAISLDSPAALGGGVAIGTKSRPGDSPGPDTVEQWADDDLISRTEFARMMRNYTRH